MNLAVDVQGPDEFRKAVMSLEHASVRDEWDVHPLRAPQKLAPHAYAVGIELIDDSSSSATAYSPHSTFGRLVLLYDADGHEAWHGTTRVVAYAQADVDHGMAQDPALSDAAWSYLTDSLDAPNVGCAHLGGTVTATTSVRYGDISGPERSYQLEMRASWTATDSELSVHLEAFCESLSLIAGLPPVGVTRLGSR